jgi:hypothetical protein
LQPAACKGRVGMQAAWRLAPARRSRRVARRSGAAQTAEALPLAALGRFSPLRTAIRMSAHGGAQRNSPARPGQPRCRFRVSSPAGGAAQWRSADCGSSSPRRAGALLSSPRGGTSPSSPHGGVSALAALLPSPRGGNCSPPRASPPRSRSTRNGEGVAWGRVGMQAAWRLAPARRSRRVARRSGAAQTAEALPLAARGRFCPRRAWGYQRHGD